MDGPFFAVDVGGSSVKSALVVEGQVDGVAREPVARGLGALVGQVVRLCEKAGAPAWGLCMPGHVDPERGRVRHAANLGIEDAPIVELLAADVPRPNVFVNDLVAATVGEAGGGTLALLQIGTGIAGRFAVDGFVPASATGLAGEVGHLRFRANGLACSCGRRGCAEAYGGWGGITSRYAEAGRAAPAPVELLREANGEILGDALEAIGFAASALVAAHDPGTLRIGGGLAAAWGETLLDAIRSALSEQVLPAVATATSVESAKLGDGAALLGLYALARSVT